MSEILSLLQPPEEILCHSVHEMFIGFILISGMQRDQNCLESICQYVCGSARVCDILAQSLADRLRTRGHGRLKTLINCGSLFSPEAKN